MVKKVVLGGVLAGLAFFIWGAVAHTALPLSKMGTETLPNRDAVLGALGAEPAEPIVFKFPSDEEVEAGVVKPVGMLVYDPVGMSAGMGKELGIQLATDLALGLLTAVLLSCVLAGLPTYGCRLGFVTGLSVLPILSVLVPYWNWYGFACAFTMAGVIEHVVGFFLAGLILAAIVKKPAPTPGM